MTKVSAERLQEMLDGPDKWVVLHWDEVNGEEIRWYDTESEALFQTQGEGE